MSRLASVRLAPRVVLIPVRESMLGEGRIQSELLVLVDLRPKLPKVTD